MHQRSLPWSCLLVLNLACGAAVEAQQPRQVPPRQLPAPVQNRVLTELSVDLGKPAPISSRGTLQKQMEPTPVVHKEPQPAPVATFEMAPVAWRQDFESTQRRPIETALFGRGPHRIAVISNLAGNSDGAVALSEQLAGLFARQELMPVNLSVLIVRNPNPDGTAGRTLTNSRGVDLNRNFPTTRFTANPTRETGARPGSEAETRAIVQLLNQFNPERVIHIVESRSTRGTVRSDDILPHELLPSFDAAPFDGVYKSGSLAGYVHQTLKRSIIEVELPQQPTEAQHEESLVQLAVTVLDLTARNVRSRFVPRNDIANQDSLTLQASQPQSDGLRGNVEFLPPPPDAGPMPDKERFIELPPPPGM